MIFFKANSRGVKFW